MKLEILDNELKQLEESLIESWEIEEFSKFIRREGFDLEKWTYHVNNQISNVKKLVGKLKHQGWTIDNRKDVKFFMDNLQNMLIGKHKIIEAHLEKMFYLKEESATKFAVLKNSIVAIMDDNERLSKEVQELKELNLQLASALNNFKEDYRDEKLDELKELLQVKTEVKNVVEVKKKSKSDL